MQCDHQRTRDGKMAMMGKNEELAREREGGRERKKWELNYEHLRKRNNRPDQRIKSMNWRHSCEKTNAYDSRVWSKAYIYWSSATHVHKERESPWARAETENRINFVFWTQTGCGICGQQENISAGGWVIKWFCPELCRWGENGRK